MSVPATVVSQFAIPEIELEASGQGLVLLSATISEVDPALIQALADARAAVEAATQTVADLNAVVTTLNVQLNTVQANVDTTNAVISANQVSLVGHNHDGDYVDLSSNQSISGTKTFNGVVSFAGTAYFSEEIQRLSSNILEIGDQYIELNSETTGQPVLDAGITVERGDLNNAILQFNETLNAWEAGIGAGLSAISLDGHSHTKASITDFNDADYAANVHTHTKASIVDFDETDYAQTIHTHSKAAITDFDESDYLGTSGTQTLSGQLYLDNGTGNVKSTSTAGWNSLLLDAVGANQSSRNLQFLMQRDSATRFQIINYVSSSEIVNIGDTGTTALQFFDAYINATDDVRISAMGSNPLSVTTKEYVDNNFVDLSSTETVGGNKVFSGYLTAQSTLQVNGSITTSQSDVNFSKPAKAPASSVISDARHYTTKEFVDGNFLSLDGGTLTDELTMNLVSGHPTFTMERNGVDSAMLRSVANYFYIQRYNGSGTATNHFILRDGNAEFNSKVYANVGINDNDGDTALTDKKFVDDTFVRKDATLIETKKIRFFDSDESHHVTLSATGTTTKSYTMALPKEMPLAVTDNLIISSIDNTYNIVYLKWG